MWVKHWKAKKKNRFLTKTKLQSWGDIEGSIRERMGYHLAVSLDFTKSLDKQEVLSIHKYAHIW